MIVASLNACGIIKFLWHEFLFAIMACGNDMGFFKCQLSRTWCL